jgi:transposase
MHRLQELVRLPRLGTPVREVARLLQMSPNTERRYRTCLSQAGLLDGPATETPELESLLSVVEQARPSATERPDHERSTVEPFREVVQELVAKGLLARAIYDRLRLQHGSEFEISYDAMKRFVRRLRAESGVSPDEVAIPVQTEPGDVAQVDFGFVGWLYDPRRGAMRKAWVFVMVLAYSRHIFAKVTFDQRAETWVQLHIEAFDFFGGAAQTLVPDNLKAAVVRCAFGVDDEPALNRTYRDLARHYGCKIDPTPPRAPKKKGKVESSVKYVKRNGLAGRDGQDIDEINPMLLVWCRDIAGQRIHGVTGRKPLEVFDATEQAHLAALPARRYEPTVWKQARVHQDSHVVFDRRLYSVPWRWLGRTVWICATASSVAIFGDDVRIATHDRRSSGTHSTLESHIPEHRRDFVSVHGPHLGDRGAMSIRRPWHHRRPRPHLINWLAPSATSLPPTSMTRGGVRTRRSTRPSRPPWPRTGGRPRSVARRPMSALVLRVGAARPMRSPSSKSASSRWSVLVPASR